MYLSATTHGENRIADICGSGAKVEPTH